MHRIKSLLLLIVTVMDNNDNNEDACEHEYNREEYAKKMRKIYVNLVHKNYWPGRRRIHPLPQHINLSKAP